MRQKRVVFYQDTPPEEEENEWSFFDGIGVYIFRLNEQIGGTISKVEYMKQEAWK